MRACRASARVSSQKQSNHVFLYAFLVLVLTIGCLSFLLCLPGWTVDVTPVELRGCRRWLAKWQRLDSNELRVDRRMEISKCESVRSGLKKPRSWEDGGDGWSDAQAAGKATAVALAVTAGCQEGSGLERPRGAGCWDSMLSVPGERFDAECSFGARCAVEAEGHAGRKIALRYHI